MFRIEVDRDHAVLEFVLEGYIRVQEMEAFVAELERATDTLSGRDIKILADLRTFRPASPEAADMIRRVQEYGLRSGVVKVAELVESQVVAHQLNRVAAGSRTDRILRRFWEEAPARQWLLSDEGADDAPDPR
ncbi:STAS/SEC14 domain-containing protein [Myxococcus stipitatus]|uniref:STAS/SEC14 domain-containing protein n=1 Tax=Myxococcus stipitatus TaxID=83455 RepID=UPI001F2A0DFF|nr:STAS/SEC14 domain-containing protein [Myxococcus stipitatus]MCE9671657.1 STAS/SEC14 domain-containing protein [Myxococcus stipitatus]